MERPLTYAVQRSNKLFLCPSCLRQLRKGLGTPRKSLYAQQSPRSNPRFNSTKSHIARPGQQASPLYGYYEDLLSQIKTAQERHAPVPTPPTRTAPASPPPTELPKTDREEALQRARVVFGSRLAGPAERRSEIERKSINVAGVLVPPRPEEPDNCCMSGCVNCVWDRYREELEDWAEKSALARERVLAQRQKAQAQRLGPLEGLTGPATGMMKAQPGMPAHVAVSMDDDGGGSETNWTSGLEMSGKPGDLFKDIPVGIREFMKTEKMLKERHRHESEARA